MTCIEFLNSEPGELSRVGSTVAHLISLTGSRQTLLRR